MRPVPEVRFRKSSYSQPTGGNCVEVADLPTGTAVRDSKHPDAGHIAFDTAEWAALLAGLRTQA